LLSSPQEVIRSLICYTDWWQPSSTSILQVAAARRSRELSDGVPLGLLATLDERTELCRRMQTLGERDRYLLFMWYVKQLSAKDIAKALKVSRRQVFRRRANAVRRIIELGEPEVELTA
jgi:DNA-directed RNA polymerase specialized sigma subunit